MAEKTMPDEQTIIAEILRRRSLNEPGIPSDQVKKFKAKLGEEIGRSGSLNREYVDQLLRQLRNGKL